MDKVESIRIGRNRTISSKSNKDIEKRVKQYFYMLTTGCGTDCSHRLCASCPSGPKLSSEAAALTALQLASKPKSLLCPHLPDADLSISPFMTPKGSPSHSPSHSRTPSSSDLTETTSKPFLHSLLASTPFNALFGGSKEDLEPIQHHVVQSRSFMDLSNILSFSRAASAEPPLHSVNSESDVDSIQVLTLTLIQSLVNPLNVSGLLDTLKSLSNIACLSKSFLDSSEPPRHVSGLDLGSVRSTFELLGSLDDPSIDREITNALELLLAKLSLHAKTEKGFTHQLRILLILLECPNLYKNNQLFKSYIVLVGSLRKNTRKKFAEWLSTHDKHCLDTIVQSCKTFIIQNVTGKLEESVIAATRMLSIAHYANTLSSESLLPYPEFYLPSLYEKLNFKEEYKVWKRSLESSPVSEFAFFNYPFLFDPVSKTRILHIDAIYQMSRSYEDAYVNQTLLNNAQRFLLDAPETSAIIELGMKVATNPFLVLDVRREHLLEDVLTLLDKKREELKKPLKVRFVGGGEEGMDQGGVQKEFFQVILDDFLDPEYGLFTYDETTRSSWINGVSLETEAQFELVGIFVGLAVYNGIILDVHFPAMLYKKLLGLSVTFEDLKDAFPDLGSGLQQLLDWSDGDVSDVFMRNFEISYDVYTHVQTIPLVKGGQDIPVTNENRIEFVEMYTDHLCNQSVRRQFNAFKKGFQLVVGGDTLELCRAEELELLVCGNRTTELDFKEVEASAKYDAGFTPSDPVIIWFWNIVHSLSLESKKKLLSFVTASDRVPLKGLGQLTFVIQKNGPDSDRLPTALTCFGRLLLPAYDSEEKLRNRLIVAIENAKGFGLI